MKRATYLDSFLLQIRLHRQLLAEDDVGVVRLLEGGLKLLQLFLGEYRSKNTQIHLLTYTYRIRPGELIHTRVKHCVSSEMKARIKILIFHNDEANTQKKSWVFVPMKHNRAPHRLRLGFGFMARKI